jgi:hypothetical protein
LDETQIGLAPEEDIPQAFFRPASVVCAGLASLVVGDQRRGLEDGCGAGQCQRSERRADRQCRAMR